MVKAIYSQSYIPVNADVIEDNIENIAKQLSELIFSLIYQFPGFPEVCLCEFYKIKMSFF